MKKLVGVVSSVLLFASSASGSAIHIPSDYSVFVSENFTGYNTDVKGRIAAGESVNLTSYSVGEGLKDGGEFSLISGGSVNVKYSGHVFNGGVYAKNGIIVTDGTLTIDGAKVTGGSSPVDFAAVESKLFNASQAFSSMDATGVISINQYSKEITLTGTNSDGITVFNLNGSDLAAAQGMTFSNIGKNEIVIINVDGKNVSFGNFGISQTYNKNILFNFYDADAITFRGVSFKGSILAPLADVFGENGNLEGNLYAKNFNGNAEFHLYSFDHDIPQQNVPEPSMISSLFLGLLGMGTLFRNKFKK